MVSTYPRDINLLLAALERSKLSQLIQREIGLDSLDFLPRAKENIYHGSVSFSGRYITAERGPFVGDVSTTDGHG